MEKEIIKTFDKAKKKKVVCGFILGDTYYRDVKNQHFMVKYNGYGIQKDVLTKLVAKGIENIKITTKRGTKHFTTVRNWVTKGKSGKYGHGDQIFLSVKAMKVT